ncbi:Gmad2 immunoglobulin-like domain-containing protein [Pseudonocardia lacus]|uniref:Gmad2 immunoglobulin-like domain-containing protein n=1 Tax=Pseudonocardia lacus TaxID=2835865 RepID=UPI001BDD3077|nr:Gmad2 immunoglobulin-like domain-containing protein [Pseudonocardia lacus]
MTVILPPDQDQQPSPQPPPPPSPARRRWATAAAVLATIAVAVSVVVLAIVLAGDAPEPDPPPVPVPTTTAAPAPTPTATAPAPTTAPAPSVTVVPTTAPPATTPPTAAPTTAPPVVPPDASTAVWPTAAVATRYDDPLAAARGFATRFVGFADPVVGPYRAGDSRSGEVDVRPTRRGPVTTVLVRRMSDDRWWVLGAASADIQLDTPRAGDVLAPPSVALTGRALAFEGTVAVSVVDDASAEPLGTGWVTGGGDELRPFEGAVAIGRPRAERGAVVLTSDSAMDGSVMAASVVRVAFAR